MFMFLTQEFLTSVLPYAALATESHNQFTSLVVNLIYTSHTKKVILLAFSSSNKNRLFIVF